MVWGRHEGVVFGRRILVGVESAERGCGRRGHRWKTVGGVYLHDRWVKR